SSTPVPTKLCPDSLRLLYLSPEDFKIVFISACAITGEVLAFNKNNTKKNPMVPIKIPMSTNVGDNMVNDDAKYSLCNEVTIITKRSNHIPMFTTIEIKNENMILVLNFLNHIN